MVGRWWVGVGVGVGVGAGGRAQRDVSRVVRACVHACKQAGGFDGYGGRAGRWAGGVGSRAAAPPPGEHLKTRPSHFGKSLDLITPQIQPETLCSLAPCCTIWRQSWCTREAPRWRAITVSGRRGAWRGSAARAAVARAARLQEQERRVPEERGRARVDHKGAQVGAPAAPAPSCPPLAFSLLPLGSQCAFSFGLRGSLHTIV